MTKQVRVGMAVVLAAGALVAGPLAGAEAWAKKSKIKCKINGETFKTNTRAGGAGGAYDPGSGLLAIGGGRAKIHGRNPATVETDTRVIDWTVVSAPDLTTATFPLAVPVTEAFFSIFKTKGLQEVENVLWLGEGVTLTITSFDGTRMKGTAEGIIPPSVGVDTDAVLEDCKFSILMTGVPGGE